MFFHILNLIIQHFFHSAEHYSLGSSNFKLKYLDIKHVDEIIRGFTCNQDCFIEVNAVKKCHDNHKIKTLHKTLKIAKDNCIVSFQKTV